MQLLAKLFGQSPFALVQEHMTKVSLCIREIPHLFDAMEKKDFAGVETLAQKISNYEHEADLTKNDIRNNLSTGLFLPVARQSVLEIISLQDNIADGAENMAILLTFLPLEIDSFFIEEFRNFLKKNLETFELAKRIIDELGELLECSFGGSEAEKVKKMVDETAYTEHQCDLLQRALMKKILQKAETMSVASFYLLMNVIKEIAKISDDSEKLANRVRMTLEVK